MRIVSDFDGVWTEPEREARAVHGTVVRELARLLGGGEEEAAGLYEEFAAAVLARPHAYGWRIDHRLASFVDEDFFCLPAAVGQFIENGETAAARRARRAVLSRWESLGAFMDHCFHSTCAAFRREVDHDLTPGAAEVLAWLLERGVAVTWATNAPAEKIIGWLGHAGFPVADARATEPGAAPLRVYGRAGKQWFGPTDRSLDVNGRTVRVDRPQYRAILERESPDLVVGDVFSLDLAVPLAMRVEGHPAAPRAVVLLARRHTPAWVLAAVGDAPDQIDHAIGHVTALRRLVAGLAAAC
ncbi:MAG: hypothetical protein D6702_05880 [Planctomycetota bacterium]|nr:MAG: hypothetical protein D6702_05880 [Planctomycetota bacterium]